MRCCERTRSYVARRTAEGKTLREIRRALKRYVTRELYRALTAAMSLDNTASTSTTRSLKPLMRGHGRVLEPDRPTVHGRWTGTRWTGWSP